MIPKERRDFLEQHRLAIVGVPRRAGPPHMTPVYYALDGDDIVISTTASRFKARAIGKNAEVSLCVLGEEQPFPYLLVYGKGAVEEAGAVDVMMEVGGRMAGNPLPESARPAVEERAKQEGRVVLRVRPEKFLP
jgi:PPOX class probable F420-dependent enzyme